MDGPDPRLMRTFGTQEVYKQKLAGGLPFAQRLALSALNVHRNNSDEADLEEQRAKAQELNDQLRAVRAQLMSPVEQGMQHTRVPSILSAGHSPGMMRGEDVPVGFDEGMVRMASACGRAIMHIDLEKDAGVGDSAVALLKGFGGAVRSAGTRAAGAVGNAATSVKGLFKAPKISLPKIPPASKPKALPAAVKASVPAPKPVPQAAAPKQHAAPSATPALPKGQVQPPAKGPTPAPNPAAAPARPQLEPTPTAPPAPQALAPGGPQSVQAPAGSPANTSTATEVRPANQGEVQTPSASGKVLAPGQKPEQSLAEHAGLGNGAWKWKLPVLAAGALGTYGAVKGTKGVLNMASKEPGQYQYGGTGAQPAAGVNEWGQPDRSTPFS